MLYFENFATETNAWLMNPGDSVQITAITGSGYLAEFPEEVFFQALGEELYEYNLQEDDIYVVYEVDRLIGQNYTGAFFTFESAQRTLPNTALLAQAERQKQDTFILAAATLAIASVSNSLAQLTASLLPKTVCVKKGKKSKSVGALQACPKGYTAKK